jgi:hypothetical protein
LRRLDQPINERAQTEYRQTCTYPVDSTVFTAEVFRDVAK